MYQRYCKRLLDIVCSVIGIVLLSPLLFLIAICIKLDSRGPALFRQKRFGLHKTYFMILKFRTMRADAPSDVPTHLLQDAHSNITRCGKILRKLSLDELPQLINVLKGEMSLVGPRPALWNQLDLMQLRDQGKANDVLPGLTGLAQVQGRDTIGLVQKAKLDCIYAQHINFLTDIRCLLRTVVKIGSGEGILEGVKHSHDQTGNTQ